MRALARSAHQGPPKPAAVSAPPQGRAPRCRSLACRVGREAPHDGGDASGEESGRQGSRVPEELK